MLLSKAKVSLRNINFKLYAALLVLGFVPTIYTTVRVFFLGQLPDEWTFSIAGQLSWVNLLYEILNEAVVLPLFFFLGKVKNDKSVFSNRIRTGLLIVFGIYTVLSSLVIWFAEPLLQLMAADAAIIEESAQYIRIESVANVFLVLSQFVLVALVSINKSKYLYAVTGVRLLLCLAMDTLFVSSLPISMNLGVNGIACSNVVVNVSLLAVSLCFLRREGVLENSRLDFSWTGSFWRVGGISGLESFVRNIAYMLMISRMVNVVGEQGTYWVANNFIWGWLLLPIIQLGELIKQEVSADKENIRKNTPGYFALTAGIVLLWFAGVPLWKPFMAKILGFDDVEKLFGLVLLLTAFYVFYAVQNVFDSIFYGGGKTSFMLFQSVVTNVLYYGGAFALYLGKIWTPSLLSIALLFGIGNVFDSVVSLAAYMYFLKEEAE